MIVDDFGLGCAECFETCGLGDCGPQPPPTATGNMDAYEAWQDCINTNAGNASAVFAGQTDAQKMQTFLNANPEFKTIVPVVANIPTAPAQITTIAPVVTGYIPPDPVPSNDPIAIVKETVATTVENVGAKVSDLISPVVTNPVSNSITGYLAIGVIALIVLKVVKGSS